MLTLFDPTQDFARPMDVSKEPGALLSDREHVVDLLKRSRSPGNSAALRTEDFRVLRRSPVFNRGSVPGPYQACFLGKQSHRSGSSWFRPWPTGDDGLSTALPPSDLLREIDRAPSPHRSGAQPALTTQYT